MDELELSVCHKERLAILQRLRARGYTLSGWCRANGFKLRTAQAFFYYGIGMKEGGEVSNQILAALEQQGLLAAPPTEA